MFAKGPMPGTTPKRDAMRHLPDGVYCRRSEAMGITGYVVYLPDGTPIVSAGSAQQAWQKAETWGQRHLAPSVPSRS